MLQIITAARKSLIIMHGDLDIPTHISLPLCFPVSWASQLLGCLLV